MNQQFNLQVNSDLDALTIVLDWFKKITNPLLPEKFRQECQLALVEGFTNTVIHAHRHLPKTTQIKVELNLFSNILEIKIWNFGQAFDFNAQLASFSLEQHKSLQKEHGLGLFFIKKLIDDVQYIRESDQRNCLIMRKKMKLLCYLNFLSARCLLQLQQFFV